MKITLNILIILANVGLVLGIIGGVFLLLVLFILSYVKAGPDTAIMVSGAGKKKILIGRQDLEFLSYKELINYL